MNLTLQHPDLSILLFESGCRFAFGALMKAGNHGIIALPQTFQFCMDQDMVLYLQLPDLAMLCIVHGHGKIPDAVADPADEEEGNSHGQDQHHTQQSQVQHNGLHDIRGKDICILIDKKAQSDPGIHRQKSKVIPALQPDMFRHVFHQRELFCTVHKSPAVIQDGLFTKHGKLRYIVHPRTA